MNNSDIDYLESLGENGVPIPEQRRRRVVMDRRVSVEFSDGEKIVGDRDVYSVMDVISKKLESTKSKDELDGLKVSVHSFEDTEKSEPPDGVEDRWVGPYTVADLEIENMPLTEALDAIAGAAIPAGQSMEGIERLAGQLFLRSRMDGIMAVATFDGKPASVQFVTPFHDITSEAFKSLYETIVQAAGKLRRWVERNRPELAAKIDWDSIEGKEEGR